MKKLLKVIFALLGLAILLFCIMAEVDGIGRFACILFGTIFTIIGTIIN